MRLTPIPLHKKLHLFARSVMKPHVCNLLICACASDSTTAPTTFTPLALSHFLFTYFEIQSFTTLPFERTATWRTLPFKDAFVASLLVFSNSPSPSVFLSPWKEKINLSYSNAFNTEKYQIFDVYSLYPISPIEHIREDILYNFGIVCVYAWI